MSALISSTPAHGAAIALRGLQMWFGEGDNALLAIGGIDLDIAAGEFITLLGPSGCGKSTLIGAVAGFLRPGAGDLRVDGRSVVKPGPDRAVVFQQHALFPWKTVWQNVEFGLKMVGLQRPERQQSVAAMLEQVGLAEFRDHYPHQLSGGMQQRVALARVLVNRPRVLLMDEPFCSLDAQTRLQMQQLLLGLWQRLGTTVVFVTHDADEAVLLSSRVIVLSKRPARIQAELPVTLPRPRTPALLTTPEFMRLKRAALELLLGEASRGS